jgi:hypothetical protein
MISGMRPEQVGPVVGGSSGGEGALIDGVVGALLDGDDPWLVVGGVTNVVVADAAACPSDVVEHAVTLPSATLATTSDVKAISGMVLRMAEVTTPRPWRSPRGCRSVDLKSTQTSLRS